MAATYKTRSRTFTKTRLNKETGKKFTTVTIKWYVDVYYGKTGPEASKSNMFLAGLTEDDAKVLGAKICYEYNQQRGDAYVKADVPPLDSMAAQFCSRKVDRKNKPIKPNTHDHNQEQLDKFIDGTGATSLDDFALPNLIDWVADLKTKGSGAERSKPNKPNTVSVNLRVLKAFCNFCVAQGWLDKNPVPNSLMDPYEPAGHYFTFEERKKLLAPVQRREDQRLQPKQIKADKLVRIAIQIGQIQGIREAQIWAICMNDYNESERSLKVPNLKRSKGNADKIKVLCHPQTLALLKEAAEINGSAPGERVFKNWGSPQTMGHAFRDKRIAVGLTEGRFHDNKHTAVSELRRQGYDAVDIEAITGTDRITIAKVYTHADKEALRKKFDTFKVDGI